VLMAAESYCDYYLPVVKIHQTLNILITVVST